MIGSFSWRETKHGGAVAKTTAAPTARSNPPRRLPGPRRRARPTTRGTRPTRSARTPGTTSPRSSRRTTGCGAAVGAWASTPRGSTARTPQPTATPSKPTSGGEPSARCSSTRRGRAAWAGASTGLPRNCPTSRTAKPTPGTSASCQTGGSAASSPASRTGAEGSRAPASARPWRRSRRPAGPGGGLPGTGRRAPAPGRGPPAHRPRGAVRGGRLQQGPSDRQVALGDAPEDGWLSTTGSGRSSLRRFAETPTLLEPSFQLVGLGLGADRLHVPSRYLRKPP
jgi:hypothetical protein